MEGAIDRKRDRKVELTKKEIYETIDICQGINDNRDIGNLNEQTQWKIASHMKNKSKEK